MTTNPDGKGQGMELKPCPWGCKTNTVLTDGGIDEPNLLRVWGCPHANGMRLDVWNTRPAVPVPDVVQSTLAELLWDELPKSWFMDLDFIDDEHQKICKIKNMKSCLLEAVRLAYEKAKGA